MSTYKRLCLLLCSLFMFCVGFLSVSNKVYAYEKEYNFYPFSVDNLDLWVFENSWESSNLTMYSSTLNNNTYIFNNPYLENVYGMSIRMSAGSNYDFAFPYNPKLYDYYFIGALYGYNLNDVSKSTFKPTRLEVYGQDFATNTQESYILNDVAFYDIDTSVSAGFGWHSKIDFNSRDNIAINFINFMNDKDGLGTKPANLIFEMGIMAFEKGQSETFVLSQILNQLQNMENSINSSIGSAADQVTDAIENQYGMSAGESFGVKKLTSQVEDKLGVLSFGADTLNNFLGLFQASNAGSTVLTFPGFTIDVQGESYKVWNDMQFDLAFLEENFGFLIGTVRTVTVLCVWLAVLGYMVKAYEHLVNNKG